MRLVLPSMLICAALTSAANPASVVLAQANAMALEEIDALWAKSYATHDTATALRIFAEDLVVTATNGQLKDRATEMRDVEASPGMTVNYFRSADVNARRYGDAGVVTGRLEWEISANGRTNALRRRYTAFYVRGGDFGWRMVALHVGQAPSSDGPAAD
jgi:ketosteroid isomerase-like protein